MSVWCRVYKASERAGNNPRCDRRHHPHWSSAASHLEAPCNNSRPTRVCSLREGTCQCSLGHGMSVIFNILVIAAVMEVSATCTCCQLFAILHTAAVKKVLKKGCIAHVHFATLDD